MNYQRPKPISKRVPLENKTRLPDATAKRLGHYTSNASHHFHKNIPQRDNMYVSHQGIHANRYGAGNKNSVRATAAHRSSLYTDFNFQRHSPKKPQ